MKTTHKQVLSLHPHFYEALGAVFYAVAFADGQIHPSETAKLYSIVENQWMKQETHNDEFGTNDSLKIEIVFDWLREETKSADDCMDIFSDYYRKHQESFTQQRKDLIWKTAAAIAAAYAGRNKSELVMLNRLRDTLKR